jgi:hypothetical protein
MLNKFLYAFLLHFIFLISSQNIFAQGLGNSPYSRLGIGDMNFNKGTVRNVGMGSAGFASQNVNYINLYNPAALANFKGRRMDSIVKFDVGFTMQYKSISDSKSSTSGFGLNVNYIAFQFPISKKWGSMINLQPVSVVDTKYSYTALVTNDNSNFAEAKYNFNGSGGVYQLQWANGYGITKNIALGLGTSMVFGNIKNESFASLPGYSSNAVTSTGLKSQSSYFGLGLKPSIMYRMELKQYVNDTLKQHKGVIMNHTFGVDLFTNTTVTQKNSLIVLNALNQTTFDSTLYSRKSKAYLPPMYRYGIAIERQGYWTLAADFQYTDWKNFDKENQRNDSLKNSYTINVGGEFYKYNKNKPIRSITYRAGMMYALTPYVINGYNIYDAAFSLGASIPVGTQLYMKKGAKLPKLNLALVVGQRSSASELLVKEMYVRLHLSILISDVWFERKKIH